ncbi:MAG: VanW family protein [Butyrivibrio sp.]|nr:VanW family protein [Butyrivibrio sp.]
MKKKRLAMAIVLPMICVSITGNGNVKTSEEVSVHMEETFTECEQEVISETIEAPAVTENTAEATAETTVAPEQPAIEAPAPAPEAIAWASIGHEDIVLYPANEDSNNVNARVACGYINGRIVKPGETFSYANTIGRGTPPEKGYVIAHVVGGYDYGGGVCKISSALYHAAKNAGCKIVERHNHSQPVDYYAQGDDAAIAYRTRKDFRFRNVFDHDVMIQAAYDETGYHLDILAPQPAAPVAPEPQPEAVPEAPAPAPEAVPAPQPEEAPVA